MSIARVACTIIVEHDPDGDFVSSSNDFPGCLSQGETICEAISGFADALAGWATAKAIETGP